MSAHLRSSASSRAPEQVAVKRVLGVDTSLRCTGYGVVERQGSSYQARAWGQIRNPPSRSHADCLTELYTGLQSVIAREEPEVMAIEGIFFSKNARTAMILGQARGIVLLVAAQAGVPVFEYAPRSVKQAVVGNGNAHKEQVQRMIQLLLSLTAKPQNDAADALALAICHLHQSRLGLSISR